MLFRKQKITDLQIITMLTGSMKEREQALRFIYIESGWCNIARKEVYKKGGDQQDADDAISEALYLLDNNIRFNRYKGESSIKNYFIGIVKGRWYSIWRSRKRIVNEDDHLKMDQTEFINPETLTLKEEQKTIVRQILQTLDPKCKNALLLQASGYSMDEISDELELSNANNTRQVIFRCRERLTKLLKDHPLFTEYR